MSATRAPSSLEGVTYRYPGTQAGVLDVTLDIPPGELVVCLGPSGCGKTTLLRLIAGFLKPDAGTIRLNGDDVSALPTRARECGIVFQAYALFPHMRVWENVAYPLRVREVRARRAPPARRTRCSSWSGSPASPTACRRSFPAASSSAWRSARALVFDPRALLLDEPLSALDAATRVTMRDEIRRIQRSQNIATLLITHDQDEALSLADRIVAAARRTPRADRARRSDSTTRRPTRSSPASSAAPICSTARAIDAETVDTPIGRLATPPHGRAAGQRAAAPGAARAASRSRAPRAGENVFAARVLRDRFFGATRQVEVAAGEGRLEIETAMRDDVAHVRVPREAIQFLNVR